MAYVGDLYGMLHAIETSSGTEKWAYIPKNLLAKLKNDRIDPNAVQDFAAVDASPTAKDVYFDHDNNGTKEWRTILTCAEGFGGKSIFVLDVTDPTAWSVIWEATDTVAPGGGMGHSYAVAVDKVKWPLPDVGDVDQDGDVTEILSYEMKWVVFVATGYSQIAIDHGGINVFAFDLKTGSKLWHFSSEYADSVNDIPGAVTLYDTDGDSFADRVYVGDMNGRLWELNALDGTNPNGTDAGKQIPLFNAGIGKPISVSPSVVTKNDHVILVFGTGGANWASDAATYAVYALDATAKQATPTYANGAGTLLWQYNLSQGEKVWSTPTIANGEIFVVTSFGAMESSDPGQDVPLEGQSTGNLHSVRLADGVLSWSISNIGKVRGSIYVDRQHVYLTTLDNQIIQVGNDDFAAGTGNRVVVRSWKQF
jgi:Tfp pilus tip-associated adhesin PilY1